MTTHPALMLLVNKVANWMAPKRANANQSRDTHQHGLMPAMNEGMKRPEQMESFAMSNGRSLNDECH
ncbi:hypothetical protein RBWH47_05137 [Rhodopirellula baltica WH47]|uniref:Uncharacterized protein n=1 Tax=Rhodopirellula baltica WH47 TaxID=991778 RepID=F2AXA1_RHOBT|nr:hypothetical protein RBWH47_05137 [Rhodopirellula baltica WH47]